jgi:secreted trypsin-like serine protease
MKRINLFLVLCVLAGCNQMQQSSDNASSAATTLQTQPIVNGRVVTGDGHLATTMLAYDVAVHYGEASVDYLGKYKESCSSSLITPNFVITAAHCICNNDPIPKNLDDVRSGMHVLLAQSERDIRKVYDIDAFYAHPSYQCNAQNTTLEHDIAIIKLKAPVPMDEIRPISPVSPSLAITAADVDSVDGVTVVDVGFGLTKADDVMAVKHEMVSKLYAYCPENAEQSKHCGEGIPTNIEYEGQTIVYDYVMSTGFMFTMMNYGTHSSTCSGDSGGPTYVWRNGIPYVAAVHSHVSSYDCTTDVYAGNTIVSDNYDFIRSVVTDLPDDTPENNCDDGIDDNGDGRMDCDDPWCFHVPVCLPEICDDKIDNNADGKTDCDDAACSGQILCQPEHCSDKIDNNGDDKVDCDDPECASAPVCQKEICNDTIDNDENGKTDCDDDACADYILCQPEICDDRIDNNGNGLIDCGEPKCAEDTICDSQICDCSDIACNHARCIEICDDEIDNNGDDKVDCADPRCADVVQCHDEVCGDGIDNNGDGKMDCDDAACASDIHCQPEICDDKIDNNGDDKIDCDDPLCAASDLCKTEICGDKIDNNGDDKVDCDDPLCAGRYVCNPYVIPDPPELDTNSGCSALVHRTMPFSPWVLWFGLLALPVLKRRRNGSNLSK